METEIMKTWEHTKTIIPQGNGLMSKRKETYSHNWPEYYSRAKGCEVWTTDGKHYFDFSKMGLGCILGYADEDVDAAAYQAIKNGCQCTVNTPLEVELAEKLLSLNPKMDMVRFSRMGGDAMAQAVRVARAYTGKEKIIINPRGYHGWHDWYMASGANGHPNAGVPECLKALTVFDAPMGEVAAIVLEPDQVSIPQLKLIRQRCTEGDIPLIFDEITCGFRGSLNGHYSTMGVVPDMVVYGKTIGNGYPLYPILGKREVMKAYEKTFISSTPNTEALGFAAGLATIEKMERENVCPFIRATGKEIKQIWQSAAKESGLEVETEEIDPLAAFLFKDDVDKKKITLYTQEMVKRGFLSFTQCWVSYAHKPELVNAFDRAVQEVFKDIAEGTVEIEGTVMQRGVRK